MEYTQTNTLPGQEPVTILVVEDNPVERQLIGKILRDANFDIVSVDCGEVVMDAVLNHQPDLILLDALMPDIDGFQVCELLRAHPKGLYIPIIMLTGLDDVDSIDRAYQVGATDFFTKPINHSLLVHRIRYLLRGRLLMDQLRLSQQSLATAQSVAKLGHWEVNLESLRFSCSQEMYQLYQLDSDLDINEYEMLIERCHPDDRKTIETVLCDAITSGKEARVEHRVILRDNSIRYIEAHMTVIDDASANETHVLGISMDITERKESEREMLRLAYFDRLTGLPNRSLLERFLDHAVPQAHFTGKSLAVLAIDLDLFNRINNSMGHAAGDAVLSQLAERIRETLDCVGPKELLENLSIATSVSSKGKQMLARLGADTFIIALPGVDRNGGAIALYATRIKALFQQPFDFRGQELFVTGSIGVAFSDSGSSLPEALLQKADLALHEAKTQGRNDIQEYSGDLVAKASSHLSIQSDLNKALTNGEFQLYYQPKISLRDYSVSGFEALIRWMHPVKGLVSPDQFIDIAEESGQIVEIGEWVLESACRQNMLWLEQQLTDVRVAVNVSARQFREQNFVEMVSRVIQRTGLPYSNLELEMTEGTLMSDPGTGERVSELRGKGISIALDDFGTGYSSLSYITRFPIDTIKIDRCFVKDIATDSEQAAIVSAVTDLSHKLNFNVVAEGVENKRELDVIRQLECDEVQGFYYCKPMSVDDIGRWLKSRNDQPFLHSAVPNK